MRTICRDRHKRVFFFSTKVSEAELHRRARRRKSCMNRFLFTRCPSTTSLVDGRHGRWRSLPARLEALLSTIAYRAADDLCRSCRPTKSHSFAIQARSDRCIRIIVL